MKKFFKYIKKSYWHLLAFVFTFLITWFGNTQNLWHLKTSLVEQIQGTQYGFQLAICTGGSLGVAVCIEFFQMLKGKNKTPFEWDNYAVPDIVVTTGSGFSGSLFAIITYLIFY